MSVPSDLPSPLIMSGMAKFQSLTAHALMRDSVLAFIELKIADVFVDDTTHLTATDIAQKKGLNASRLYRLLHHVKHFGVVETHESEQATNQSPNPETCVKFSLTADGALLRSDHPSKVAAWYAWMGNPLTRYCQSEISDVIKEPAADYKVPMVRFMHENDPQSVNEFGDDVFNWMIMRRRDEIGLPFNEAMTGLSAMEAPDVAQIYSQQLSQTHTLMDIGGSLGTLAATIASKHSNVKHAVVADLPPVIAAAKQQNEGKRHGVVDRFSYSDVDFFQVDTLKQSFATHFVDAIRENKPIVIIMKHILHDWSDEKSLIILKNISTALSSIPGASSLTRLALAEMNIVPTDNPASVSLNWVTSAMDTHMFMCGGIQRNRSQWEKLFQASGWHLTDMVVQAHSPISIVEAKTI